MANKTLLTVILACAFCASTALADFYRWTDENGDTHYSDQVPADDTKSGRDRLNEGGRVIDSVERAMTPEELAVFKEKQRIARIKREKEEAAAARDRVLLATFTNVEEMEQARDERVALIEQSVNLARTRLLKQQKELVKLGVSRERFLERELDVPNWIEENEGKVLATMASIEEYILDRELEKQELKNKFKKDIERFTELTQRNLTVR